MVSDCVGSMEGNALDLCVRGDQWLHFPRHCRLSLHGHCLSGASCSLRLVPRLVVVVGLKFKLRSFKLNLKLYESPDMVT